MKKLLIFINFLFFDSNKAKWQALCPVHIVSKMLIRLPIRLVLMETESVCMGVLVVACAVQEFALK